MSKHKKLSDETKKEIAEKINFETGEVVKIALEKLNKVIVKETKRSNGTIRIQQDFSNCPTMAEQHTAHLTDINYLMERYKPDELAAYISARNQHRQEIVGHNFASEPSLQDARNIVYLSKSAFEELPDPIKNHFGSHLAFLKFADIPSNAQKLIDQGIITPDHLQRILISDTQYIPTVIPKEPSTPPPTPSTPPPTT